MSSLFPGMYVDTNINPSLNDNLSISTGNNSLDKDVYVMYYETNIKGEQKFLTDETLANIPSLIKKGIKQKLEIFKDTALEMGRKTLLKKNIKNNMTIDEKTRMTTIIDDFIIQQTEIINNKINNFSFAVKSSEDVQMGDFIITVIILPIEEKQYHTGLNQESTDPTPSELSALENDPFSLNENSVSNLITQFEQFSKKLN